MKNALVTGGSGGIGAAICRRLAADGCHVYIHANRGTQAAQTLRDAICADGGSAQVLTFDVTDSQAVAEVLTPLVEHQPIQILINNAGIHDDAVFPGMQASQWHRVIDTSITRCHCEACMPGNTASSWMPALLIRIWIGWCSTSGVSTSATAWLSVTSNVSTCALPPSAQMASRSVCAACVPRLA